MQNRVAKESCVKSFVTVKLHGRGENLESGKWFALNGEMNRKYTYRVLVSLSWAKTEKKT